MRTSLNESKAIEDYIFNKTVPSDKLVFDARMILDKSLRKNVQAQKQVYELIRLYGRQRLRAEIEAVHDKLFHTPEHKGFRDAIIRIFA